MTFIDPVEQAKRQEGADRLPFITPQAFETKYEPQPDGSMRAVDWVTWIKKGVQNPSTVEMKIPRLSKHPNPEWEVIEPYYKKWKEGQTAPVNGLALTAWPGATKELIKVMDSVNIKTVEDFALIEDSAIMKLAMPNLRQMKKNAQAFLDAQRTTSVVAADLAKLRDENDYLRNTVEELKTLVKGMAGEKGVTLVDDIPVTGEPKRRGRPPGSKNKAA